MAAIVAQQLCDDPQQAYQDELEQAAREGEYSGILEAEPSQLSIIIDQRMWIVWFLVFVIVLLTIFLIRECCTNKTKQVHAAQSIKLEQTPGDLTPNHEFSPKEFPTKLNLGGGSSNHSRKNSI